MTFSTTPHSLLKALLESFPSPIYAFMANSILSPPILLSLFHPLIPLISLISVTLPSPHSLSSAYIYSVPHFFLSLSSSRHRNVLPTVHSPLSLHLNCFCVSVAIPAVALVVSPEGWRGEDAAGWTDEREEEDRLDNEIWLVFLNFTNSLSLFHLFCLTY